MILIEQEKYSYPRKIYASVLLLDNKIYNYKIGQYYWESPNQVTMKIKDFDKIHRMKVEYTTFIANNPDENEEIFQYKAKEWFKNWKIHEGYIGNRCY